MRNRMTESTARFTLAAASGLGTFAGIVAISLGLRGARIPALIFLVLALVGCLVGWMAHKQHTRLRRERWRRERARGEEELSQMLNHTRMNMIVDHMTGPLDVEQASKEPDEKTVKEPGVADS